MIGKNLIKGFDGHFEGAVSTLELRPRPSTCSCISSKDDHVFVVGLWIGTSSQYQMFEANLQIRYKMSKSLQRSSFSQGKRWDEDNFVGLICLSILTHKGYIKRLFWCNPCVWGWLRPTRLSTTRRALSRTKFCEKFYLLGVHVLVVLRDLGDHLCPAACCITSKRLNIRHFEHNLLAELRISTLTLQKFPSFFIPDFGPSNIQTFCHPFSQLQPKLLHQWRNFVSRASVDFGVAHLDNF